MESNWRHEVYEQSMGWSDWELCARLDGIPFIPLVVKKVGDNATAYFYSYATPTLLPALLFTVTLGSGAGNFPWGFPVLPD